MAVFIYWKCLCVHTLLVNPSESLEVCIIIVPEYSKASFAAISAVVWTKKLFKKTFQNT